MRKSDWLLIGAGVSFFGTTLAYLAYHVCLRAGWIAQDKAGGQSYVLPDSVLLSDASALVVYPVLIYIAFVGRRDALSEDWRPSFGINLLSIIAGTAAGWALAVFWVPFDKIDGDVYGKIGASVALVLGGYVFARADKLLTLALGDGLTIPPRHVWCTLGVGIGALAYSAIVIVTSRVEYLQMESSRRADELILKAEAAVENAQVQLRYLQNLQKLKPKAESTDGIK